MGMYTELYISAGIKKDAPEIVKDVIRYLFSDAECPEALPGHSFFKCQRWDFIGKCSSFYFTPFPFSTVHNEDVNGVLYFTSRSDLKNYDGEIGKFLDWVDQYLEAIEGEHIGHYRYEEEQHPTLIYKK